MNPHASWASVYDITYEQSFGTFYKELTSVTIDVISNALQPPARIVDFGAGTGRLSIPLSVMGYNVFAVDPSSEMLNQLTSKDQSSSVNVFNGKMQDFQSDIQFDMAICVFTVLIYILDEEALEASINVAADLLKSGGFLLVDIPSKGVFQDFQCNTQMLQRTVSVAQIQDDIYTYDEFIKLNLNNQNETYTDHFRIKWWDVNYVLKVLAKYGLSIQKDLSSTFAGAGSSYFLMRKG